MVCTLTRLDDSISWLFCSPWFICVLSTEGTSGLRLSYLDHPQSVISISPGIYTTWVGCSFKSGICEANDTQYIFPNNPQQRTQTPSGLLFWLENARIMLTSSPRLGNRRASIHTEHRRVPTYRIGKMRGLRILSQHVQTSNILTNLAVNNDGYYGVDLPLCR